MTGVGNNKKPGQASPWNREAKDYTVHAVIEVNDSSFNHYWSELFANDPLQNPLYSQQACACLSPVKSQSGFVDRSFVVITEHKPVFACSLTMHVDDKGKKRIGYFGFEASSHVNRLSMQAPSNNFQPEAIHLLQHHINHLIEEIKPDTLDYLDPVSCGIMSPVTQVLLEKGALPVLQTAKIIDLTLSEHALQHQIRKGQRGLINWGQRNLEIDVLHGEQFEQQTETALPEIFNEAHVAGRSPFSSLQSYEDLIRQEKAFLVQARLKSELVAGALFLHADRTCHFVFGSRLPQAPNRPMIHALVWRALQHSKKLGCQQFELGRLATTENANSDRVKFLNGFGGESQTRLKVSLIA